MTSPENPTEQPPQHPYEALQAFRAAMEAAGAAYRVKISYFDRVAGRPITYEASLWGDAEEPKR